jgi:energy-coupling factor transporter ATP-binding protein EcfA2
MLSRLTIQNYALIDCLDISFPDNLVIITGETGAGKSILLGALSLVLGGRSDISTLKDRTRNCVVEAIFNLEEGQECILRRVISPNGRSRIFIDDEPATLEQIRNLSESLVDIHSQHQHLVLSRTGFQTSILDHFAGLTLQVSEYEAEHAKYLSVCREISDLEQKIAEAARTRDYLEYQYAQLERASLVEGELEELEAEQAQLANSEEILQSISRMEFLFQGEDDSISSRLKEIESLLERLSSFIPEFRPLANRINTFTDYCNSNKIPFVSPLDVQTDSLALHNRYFFQMPVTTATQTTNLIGRINLSNNSRLTLFSDAAGSEEPYRRNILAAIDSAGLPCNEIRYHIVSGRTIIDSLLIIMNPDVEHHIVVASEQEAFASDVIRNMGVLKFNGYNIKVYCSNRVRNFETIEGILLHEVNTHISTNYFVDYGDKATKEFILGYRALFNTEPTPFAFHGYDTFLYFIRVINDLGKDFPDLIYYYPLNMLQTDIRFRRTGPDGGFINIESRDLEYTPDKKITVR